MYNVMIVDDEPMIVDGLYDLFLGVTDIEIQLHAAYSADEALDIVYRTHMDVIFTDIRMPGMNGIELQHRIAQQWPMCKVIFLTGHNDFAYVQSAIRQGGTDYILKTESFEVVEQALRKAIREKTEALQSDRLIRQARQRMTQALPMMQRRFVLGWLEEKSRRPISTDKLDEQFKELELPLDAASKVLILIGRVDTWNHSLTEADKQLYLYAIENICGEYFASVRVQAVQYERSKLIWLIQPDEARQEELDRCAVFIHGTLESIQSSCRDLLQLSISFIASQIFLSWSEVPDKFQQLTGLLLRGMGQSQGTILTDRTDFGIVDDDRQFRRLLMQSPMLEHYLESGSFAACHTLIRDLVSYGAMDVVPPHLQKEAYLGIATRLLSHLNRSGLSGSFAAESSFDKLLDMNEHESWTSAGLFFESVVDFIADNRFNERNQMTNHVVSTINRYIQTYYAQDLSLTKLSSIVHLNSSYLCRLYKQTTDVGLSDYINQFRIGRAKELLAESLLKIQDIAAQTGFDSSAYFGRVFKKATNMTPQEYRDAHQG